MNGFTIRTAQEEASRMVSEQAERFNSALSDPETNKELILDMEEKVKDVYKALKRLSKTLEENIEDSKKGCLSSTGRKITLIIGGAAIGMTLGIAAQGYASFSQESLSTKSLVFAAGSLANVLSQAAGVYGNVVWLSDEKIEDLVQINKDGIEQAKLLKKLIRQVKKIEQVKPTDEGSDSKQEDIDKDSVRIDIKKTPDEEIQEFLANYEKLKVYSDEMYFKIIPNLIQKILSPDDPLKDELRKLEISATLLSKASPSQALPVNYLNSSPDHTPKIGQSGSDWESEQQAQQEEGEGRVKSKALTIEAARREYAYQWICFNEEIRNRFNIHRGVPYLEANGIRLTAGGVLQPASSFSVNTKSKTEKRTIISNI